MYRLLTGVVGTPTGRFGDESSQLEVEKIRPNRKYNNGGLRPAKSLPFRWFRIAVFEARCQNALPRLSAGGVECFQLSTPSVLGENSLIIERISPRIMQVIGSSCGCFFWVIFFRLPAKLHVLL